MLPHDALPRSDADHATAAGPRGAWNRLAGRLERLLPEALLALVARLGVAGVFFFSGRAKVDGWLTVNDGARMLFAEEYRLPLLAPDFAAHLATYAEHLLPVLLVMGLGTRLAALALLAMTALIQVFVYPDAWPTHLSWAAPLLYLAARGGGRWSADRAIGLR